MTAYFISPNNHGPCQNCGPHTIVNIMSGFFDKIKDVFGSTKKTAKFKIYQPAEIKMLALRTRVILTESMDQLLKHIYADDQKFRLVGTNPAETYTVLQSIGEKVIEAESIKIFVEMMRKIENNSTNIAKTNGDIALLKTEVQWFQCVLWYRKAKQVAKLDDLYTFCLDFFKGVDVTKEIDVNCQVFKLYPILKYLKKNDVLPLAEVLFYLQPYVSCNISKPTLDAIFEVNKQDIARRSYDRSSLNDSKTEITGPSRIYPNSAIFAVEQSPPKRDSNPYEIQEPLKPQNNQGGNSYIGNPMGNSSNIQPNNNFVNPNGNFYPQNQNTHGGNTLNLPYGNTNYNQFPPQQPTNNQYVINSSGFAPQNSNYSPYSIPDSSHLDHNPFSNSKLQNHTLNNNPQHISNFNIPPNNPTVPEKKQPIPSPPPPPQPKKSFFNSLMRANSQQTRINNDRERQQGDFIYNQGNQSFIPLNRDSYDQFNNPNHYAKEYELEQKRKKEAEQLAKAEELRKAEEQRKAQEIRRAQELKRTQQLKKAEEEAIRIQLQRKIRQDQQRRLQQIRQKQREKAQQLQMLKRKEEQQARARAEQVERRAQEQELRREREEEQRERERQERMREREREQERQLNVFVDNQRETFDRGFSGRFSSNMGFKYDFEEYQAEELASDSHNMNSSILRFKKDESAPVMPVISLQEQDETESLQLIECGHDSTNNPPFKLFYYKKEGK